MAYTLRGRLESRLATALAPLLVAGLLAAVLGAWWPLQVAALMLAVGVGLDVAVLHRLLPYQPGWAAVPIGLTELALVLALAWALGIAAPLVPALVFFAGAWLFAQVLGHAVLPVARLTYADDGGELGRAGLLVTAGVLAALAFAGGAASGAQPPTVRLGAGVHEGPLVLDRAQTLVGERGAVVRAGILVTADDVTIRGVAVEGGDHGIEIDGAERVVVEDVTVSGSLLDGINVRRGSVTIRDCRISGLAGDFGQGIDISFGFDLPTSVVERCTVHGGLEGIVSHFSHVHVRDNRISGTRLRAIDMTEMSMARVEDNHVSDSLGVGIFCGDYSMCDIENNHIAGTRPDRPSGDKSRLGYAIVSHYGAKATLDGNELVENAADVGAFINARIEHR